MRSYDLALSPLRQQVVSLSQSSSVSQVELTDGRRGEGVLGGEGAKSYDREKVWSSIIIQYSLWYPFLLGDTKAE